MMGSQRALGAYLAELSPLLTGSARRRRRILAEISDHALSELEARRSGGQAEPEAAAAVLACVGDARTVAAGFAETGARRACERAEHLVLASVLAFGTLFVLSTQVADLRAGSALARGAAPAVGWIASQVAPVAVAIAWLRGRRLRSAARATVGALSLSLRAAALAVGFASVALSLDALALLGSSPSSPTAPAFGFGLVVAAGVTVIAALSVACATAQVRGLRRLDDEGDDRAASALEELGWAMRGAVERAEALCERHPGRLPAAVAAAAGFVDRALTWALARRAGTAAAVGAAAGAVLAAGSLREHGLAGGAHQALLAVVAAGVLFALEASAVIASVYLFDRLLRLWPPAARRGRQVAA